MFARLPLNLGSFTAYNYLGWAWDDKGRLHAIHGPVFLIVTPTENQLIVGHAEACNSIFKDWRNFVKNPAFNMVLDIFGPNVGTAEGNDWQRQRKITTVAFNESNNSLVWSEAVRQAKQMLRKWTAEPVGITSTTQDTNLFALHLLAGAGFGFSCDFDSALELPAEGHSMSYRGALGTIMGNIFLTFTISSLKFPAYVLPRKIRQVLEAMKEFRSYMAEIVATERTAYGRGEDAKSANLMSSIIRASEEAGEQVGKEEKARSTLTDEEIWGNLFIYNVAGHETTAMTLAYAIGILACNPTWQDWVKEELDNVFGSGEIKESQYQETYPLLKRCLAILYETLRLYAPLNGIPRYTGNVHQQLQVDSELYTIPPHTAVFLNNAAVQCDKKFWGPNSRTWCPGRWIQTDGADDVETFAQTPAGAYLPWASGPRVCPGKKFSQVEFVAAIACLMHQHRVVPVVGEGETEQQAQERLMKVMADSNMTLANKINHPKSLVLKWERRSSR
ncbi:hypothetical protein MMC27_008875 [Xylographa pallens]|nr:hypothetical protein [Xylographa pallens]